MRGSEGPSGESVTMDGKPDRPRRARSYAMGGFLAAGLTAMIAAGGNYFDIVPFGDAEPEFVPVARIEFRDIMAMTVDDKSQILVEGEDAVSRNAKVPLAGLPLEKVRAFGLGLADAHSRSTAQRCLAQAIYYEAANEPLQGRRAVAQVVLNRVRHSAYPASVCGVVYQGSERRTGCQFSFTCDGSLLRQPSASRWREAERVASEALAGRVEPSVGTATHYHADYVLPKWAFELGKIAQLGRHIFYRFKGGWGRSAAFGARYSGIERIPTINFAALTERAEGQGKPFVPGLTVTPHVTDRHAATDVGGRIDTTKQWRLRIPDPVNASSRYTEAVSGSSRPETVAPKVAVADAGPGAP